MKRRDFLGIAALAGVAAFSGRVQGEDVVAGPRVYVQGVDLYKLFPEKTRPDDVRGPTEYALGRGPDSDKMLIKPFAWRGKATWLGLTQAGEHRLQYERSATTGVLVLIWLKLTVDDQHLIDMMDLSQRDQVEFFGTSADNRAVSSPSDLRIRLDNGMMQLSKLSAPRQAAEDRKRKTKVTKASKCD